MQEDKDKQAEFEPAVAQSARGRGTERASVMTGWVSSFEGPPRTVVVCFHLEVPPDITALCLYTPRVLLQQPCRGGTHVYYAL